MKKGIRSELLLFFGTVFLLTMFSGTSPCFAQKVLVQEKSTVNAEEISENADKSTVLKKKTLIAQKAGSGSSKKKQSIKEDEKELTEYISDAQKWLITSGLHVALILLLTAIALKSTNVLRNQLLAIFAKNREGTELKKRADTASSVVRYVLIVTILAISGMMILKELGIDIGPILAGAGVVGLAVGFGAQNLVKDVISGFFILLEDQIRVGDVVQIADKSGVVEKVTLRMVVLRDVSYNVHYIPSGEITVVTNMTKSYSGFVFDIGVAYREDIDEVMAVMEKLDKELRKDKEYKHIILEPLEMMGLQELGDSSVVVRARTKTETGMQWKVGREYKKRLKKRFDELGIEIPFPHVTVYAGVDKEGKSPPVNVALSGIAGGTGKKGPDNAQ